MVNGWSVDLFGDENLREHREGRQTHAERGEEIGGRGVARDDDGTAHEHLVGAGLHRDDRAAARPQPCHLRVLEQLRTHTSRRAGDGQRRGCVVGDSVHRAVRGGDDGTGDLRLEAPQRRRVEQLGRDPVPSLQLDPLHRARQVLLTFDELQLTQTPIAGRSADAAGELVPPLVGKREQRQLAWIAPVGAHASLTRAAGRTARDGGRFEHEHLSVALREVPRRGRTVNTGTDNHVVRPHSHQGS